MVNLRNDRPLHVSPASTDERSPVVARGVIQIAAAAEVVWEVLTDFARWPDWNPDVRSMSISEPVAVGSSFRWRAGPGTITSTIQRVEPPRVITWSGRTLGIKALNSWLLEPGEGTTMVREEESFDGLIARLLRRPLQRSLDRSLQNGLQHLKTEAERRIVHTDIEAQRADR